MIEVIPNELIDYILDKLYFDTATLLKCALVARAWVYPSQRGIFREIRLDPQFDEERVDDYLKISEFLAALFAGNPRLASYVRLLELQHFTKPNIRVKPELLNAFVSIVQHLSDVKKLELFDVNWKFLSPSLRSALTDFIRTNSLTGITLLFFSIPTFAELVSLLGENTFLKVLETNVTCDVWDVPDTSILESDMDQTVATNPRSIRLDRLQFLGQNQISSFLAWFRQDSCPLEVRNLQLLHLGSSISSDLAVQTLQYVGSNLSGLMLAFFQDHLSVDSNVDYLKYTPNLCSLHLLIFHHDILLPVFQILFKPFLSRDGRRSGLQHLYISLAISPNDSETIEWEKWGLIDRLLAKPAFTLLRMVIISLDVVDHTSARALLSGQMPFLEGSGRLTVERL